MFSFNRTILECKSKFRDPTWNSKTPFNRTILECKYVDRDLEAEYRRVPLIELY